MDTSDILDYWGGAVIFEGDGTSYVISMETVPFVQLNVSNSGLLNFIINPYTSGTTNQPAMTVELNGSVDGDALATLTNEEIIEGIAIVEAIIDAVHGVA